MTSFRALKKIAENNLDKDNKHIGNDMALFGEKIKDVRLQIAFEVGWLLRSIDHKKTAYFLIPPKHFECSKKNWGAEYTQVRFNGCVVNIPHWYYEDRVLVTGSRTDK